MRVSICAGVSGRVHVYFERKVAAKPRAWRLATFVQHQILKEGPIQVPAKSADSGRNKYDTRCVCVAFPLARAWTRAATSGGALGGRGCGFHVPVRSCSHIYEYSAGVWFTSDVHNICARVHLLQMVDAHGAKAARVLGQDWTRRSNSRRHDAAGY